MIVKVFVKSLSCVLCELVGRGTQSGFLQNREAVHRKGKQAGDAVNNLTHSQAVGLTD